MSDYLQPEMIDEYLSSHFPELWPSASDRVVYCQQHTGGAIELYGNAALALSAPHQALAAIAELQLSSWINLLDAIGPLSAMIVAGQDLYATVIGCTRHHHGHLNVLRVVEQGDGQTPASLGTEAEQNAALRILATRDNTQNRVVVMDVAGTDLVFVQANFPWTPAAAFDLSLCRPLPVLCNLIIPQLVARKGISEIIFADQASADRAHGMENMEPYQPLLRVEPDPDALAVSNRDMLQQLLAHSPVGLENITHKVGEWLTTARDRFRFASHGAASQAATAEKLRLLRLFLQLVHTRDVEIIRALSAELTQSVSPDEFTSRLRRAAWLIAHARLGEITAAHQPDIDVLLITSTENDIWWPPAIAALTQHWVQYGFPDNWLAQINDRGTAALLDVSAENPTSYQKIRTEWLRLLNGNERDFILPFAAFNDEVDLGGNYRKLQRLVDSALAGEVSSAAKHPSGKHKALLAERERTQFYRLLTFDREYYSSLMIRRLLEKAKTAWGASKEHFTAEFLFLFSREQDFAQAEHCAGAWISAFPEDDNAWFYSGTLKREAGQPEEARRCFLHAATLTDYKKPALVEAALCLWSADNIEGAEAELQALIDPAEPYPPAFAVLGLIAIVAHDYARALTLFRQITIDDIDANGVLYPWLHCLLLQEGWEATGRAFSENVARMSDRELALYITGATLTLSGSEQGCQIAARTFAPLLKFEEHWNSAIDSVIACCFKSGDWQTGRELALRALANPWGSESQALQLVYSFLYQPQAQDFPKGFALASGLVARFPDSFLLCNLAGELAEANGLSGEDYFRHVAALLTPLQRDERQNMSLALALCNLHQFSEAYQTLPEQVTEPYQILSRILIACVAGLNNIDEFYSLAKAQLVSAEFLDVKEALHVHLTDLERYGQRGLIPDWHLYHAIAAALFPPEGDAVTDER